MGDNPVSSGTDLTPPHKDLAVPTEINVRVPVSKTSGWKTALVLLGSGLLSLAYVAFSNYLQTRGFVSVGLARIFLGIAWLAGIAVIVIAVMAFGLRRRNLMIGVSICILTGTLLGLEVWASYRLTHGSKGKHTYPFITAFPNGVDEKGRIKSVGLGINVEDYPPHGPPRLSSLFNFHLVVSRPIAVFPEPEDKLNQHVSWCSCRLVDARWPEWNNDNNTGQPAALIPFTTDSMVLEIQASSRNGEWLGELLIRRQGDHIEVDEWISGAITSGSVNAARMLSHRSPQLNPMYLMGKKPVEDELLSPA
jgi:hypothetical protein